MMFVIYCADRTSCATALYRSSCPIG